jgi:hypothetical protein
MCQGHTAKICAKPKGPGVRNRVVGQLARKRGRCDLSDVTETRVTSG